MFLDNRHSSFRTIVILEGNSQSSIKALKYVKRPKIILIQSRNQSKKPNNLRPDLKCFSSTTFFSNHRYLPSYDYYF